MSMPLRSTSSSTSSSFLNHIKTRGKLLRGGGGGSSFAGQLPSCGSSPKSLCWLVVLSILSLSTVVTLLRISVPSTSSDAPNDNPLVTARVTSVRSPSQRHADVDRVRKRAELAAARRNRHWLWGDSRSDIATRRGNSYSNAGGADSPSSLPLFQFNYSQPTARTRFTLSDPQLYLNESMIILILSARENFERRRAIRETWGKDHPVYFVIGGPVLDDLSPPENKTTSRRLLVNSTLASPPPLPSLTGNASLVQQLLQKEQAQFHDMLDSIHPDSYNSLTHKVRFGYRWVLEHNPRIEWLVKVDDDTVVRVDTLATAFLRNFNPSIPMVIGRIIEKSPVARTGKWADHLYPHPFYPFWPQGSCGHVVSRVVAEYVATTPGLVYYQGEDVSIGIWLDESDLQTTWIHSDYFSNDRKCLKHAWLIMGHEVTESEMRECYQHADEWPIEDIRHKHRRYWKVTNLYQRKD